MVAALTSVSLFFTPVSLAGEKVDATLPSAGVNTVTVENLSGDVTIIGWDDAVVKVKGELDDNAEKLIFEQTGKTITIKVDMPNRGSWNSKGSKLIIHMPTDLRLNFESVSSDVELENLTNNVAVKTVSGDIKATKLNNRIELISVSGNISTKSLQGDINLSTVSGDIKDKDSKGVINFQAVSGEINVSSQAHEVSMNNISGNSELNLAEVDEFKASTVSGDTEVRLSLKPNAAVKASTVSGSLEFDFQNKVSADFRLKANAGGDLINKLTNQKADLAKYGPSSKLFFQTGDANGSVRVNTVSGEVTVK
mgnify:CR=1 FL=1